MNEKISVIIPLYNKEPEIKRTLDSVLSQTYQNFEIIVVDDHSSDRGPAIVKSFLDPRIFLIEQEHRGETYTRNHGVDLATSNFIAFLDADDEWMPRHLETILGLIETYPDAGMYSTSYKIQDKGGNIRSANYNSIPNPPWEGLIPDYFKSAALGDHPINSTAVVIPKKIFCEMGGFPVGCWYGGDVDLYGKIALKYPVAFSRVFGAIYHWDATNRVCEREYPRDYQEPFMKTARDALMRGEVKPEYIESLNEYLAHREIFHAINYIRSGSPDIGESILNQCTTKWHHHEKMKWLLLAKLPYPIFLSIQEIRRKIIKILRRI